MPDVSMVHVDTALTNVSIAYHNAQFVADAIFPPIPVTKQSNKYFIYSKDRFRVMADARRPGARANEINWTLSTNTYYAEGHALAQAIPDELRANADQAIDVDVDTTETLTDLIFLQREILAANFAMNAANITQNTTLSGTNQWSNTSSPDPVTTVEEAKPLIQQQIGLAPNALLVSYPVFTALRNHPAIIDRFKYTQVGVLQPDHLKSAFNVDFFFVAAAIMNTAGEGEPDNFVNVWGNNALLWYKPPAPGRRTVSLGYQFTWLFGANTNGFLVKRYREESRTADVVETQLYYDLQLVAPQAGYLWLSAVA
jgi:hypothetical protein